MAEQAMVSAVRLADAKAAKSGGFDQTLAGACHIPYGEIVPAACKLAKVFRGFTPMRRIVYAPGIGLIDGSAANFDVQDLFQASLGRGRFGGGDFSGSFPGKGH